MTLQIAQDPAADEVLDRYQFAVLIGMIRGGRCKVWRERCLGEMAPQQHWRTEVR